MTKHPSQTRQPCRFFFFLFSVALIILIFGCLGFIALLCFPSLIPTDSPYASHVNDSLELILTRLESLANLAGLAPPSQPHFLTQVDLRSVPILSFPLDFTADQGRELVHCLLSYPQFSHGRSFCGLSSAVYLPGEPLILRGLPNLLETPAFRDWRAESLVSALGALADVCLAKPSSDPTAAQPFQPFFYYDKKRPFFAAARSHWRAPFDVRKTMSAAEFLSLRNVYYSSKLLKVPEFQQHPELQSALNPLQQLIPDPTVWITAQGMISRLHFDAGDNLYFQLSGAKEFVLLPPKHHWAADLYPALHPSARQSQLPLERILRHNASAGADEGTFLLYDADWLFEHHPLFDKAIDELKFARLQAGDMLLVPGFWLHHVTSLSDSFSLSGFVQNTHRDAMHAIFSYELPFLGIISELGEIQQQTIAFEIISLLIHGAGVLSTKDDAQCDPRTDYCFLDQRGWLKALVFSRYHLLHQDPMLGSAMEMLMDPGDLYYYCGNRTVLKELPSFAVNALRNAAQHLIPLFLQLPIHIRHIALADFVEQTAQLVLSTHFVHSYLVFCSDQQLITPPISI